MSASEETLFADVLAQPEALRAAFLEQACESNGALRVRLDALLAAHENTESLLTPIVLPPAPSDFSEEKPGDRFGHYKLLLKLGEGGCGVVFMAEQEEPVQRRVALKVIKAGMDTREVIARFNAERQALALMDHPGICKVLDAGATKHGRPFFVMELVRGVPITRYCDENQLPTRARLELFIQVCHAVQHAHQKGIIHRDLKPSNILVTLHGGAAAPKVIDFGIAKATQGPLTDATLVTAYEQFLGTPAYMSPEQAEMSGLDVDTRTDVYSLGVLLYELLTGRPPFDPKSLLVASRDELRRIIREVEPPKPSTQLSTLAGTDRSTVAKRRGTDAAKLRLLLSGDLDWIVMKALEKNRGRRYATPAALVDDITRHLQHEPVVARPPGNFYWLGKFIRRHRVGVAAIASVALALVVGSGFSIWQAVRAKRAEHQARAERDIANTANRAEAQARADARRRQEQAEELLFFMLGDLRVQLERAGRLDLIESVGDKAMTYIASLNRRDLNDSTLSGKVKALALIGAVRVSQTRYPEAMSALTEAYELASKLTGGQPKNGDRLFDRGQVEYWIGYVHRKRGDLAAMENWFTRYRDTSAALVALDPKKSSWQEEMAYGHHNLAVVEFGKGKYDDARRGFLAELDILAIILRARPKDPLLQFRIVDADSWLGSMAERSGDFTEAAARFAQQVAHLEAIAHADPGTAKWRVKLADALALQAGVLAVTGRRAEALERRNRAKALLDALVAVDPDNLTWQMASLYFRLKEVPLLRAEGNTRKATELIEETLESLEKLATVAPTDRELAGRVAIARRLQAELSDAMGRPGAAVIALRAVELGEALIAQGRLTDEIVGEHAHALLFAGRLAAQANERDSAFRHWRHALELIETRLPTSRNWRVLDPAARVFAALDDEARKRSTIDRLHRMGYQPLEPWP